MILGVPKEVLANETRVAVIPATVKQYISAGLNVTIESGAGHESLISDDRSRTSKIRFRHLKPIQQLSIGSKNMADFGLICLKIRFSSQLHMTHRRSIGDAWLDAQ